MAPTTSLTLTYFDFAGPAEPVRMALAMTGQPWEDKRVSFSEFPALKPGLPNGQLPILEVGGKVLPQSGAQLRYVGKLAGLYPEDALEAALADAAVDSVGDNHMKLAPTVQQKDKVQQMEMRQNLVRDFLPTWLGNLEKALANAGGTYFAGGKLSIGDIAVVARLVWLKEGSLDGIPTSIVDEYPLLSALIERVNAEPNIAKYHQERSETTNK
uniref:Glutathione S-transferase 2 n=1 Tax=Laminaria digitata TaxID=80365 RepID=B1N8E7_9PHAE|nr:glutathione S-transferase 2 [Laminaria digitata]